MKTQISQENGSTKSRIYRGVVISDKMEKTVVVRIETVYQHPQFGKTLRRSKKYKVHDEHGQAKVGSIVEFLAGRPVSKTKRMHLIRVISESVAQ